MAGHTHLKRGSIGTQIYGRAPETILHSLRSQSGIPSKSTLECTILKHKNFNEGLQIYYGELGRETWNNGTD